MSMTFCLSSNGMKHINLTGKLSLLVTFGVIVSVGILSCYFDSFLKNNFFEDTTERMLNGFQHLESDIKTISQDLQEGIFFIQTDEFFLASIDLINNYQDTNNYNAALLDEEKKSIAQQLLNRVKLSLNHLIVLYDKNEELIAFVVHKRDGYHLNFISYKEGRKTLYSRHENQTLYVEHPFPETGSVNLHHRSYYSDTSAEKGTITYHILHGKFIATSHLSIFNDERKNLSVHIEMSHLFYDEYFRELSTDLDLTITYSTANKNSVVPPYLFKINNVDDLTIQQSEKTYFSTAKIATFDNDFYYRIELDNEKLLSTLSRNRRHYLALIVIVATLVLMVLRLIFSKTLINPLELLMGQIYNIEKQDYTQCVLVQTGDELETISKNINKLSASIQEREDALLESQKKLEYLSQHDTLTELPNRRLFISRLKQAIEDAERSNQQVAVLFLDLDEFKQVNDTLGHDIGDQLLVKISLRLAEHIQSSVTLARLGGDEFTLFIENINSKRNVGIAAGKLLAKFEKPFTCAGHELSTTASIGIAIYPDDGMDTMTLIRHADMAMYQSKDAGRNGYSFFSVELSTSVRKRIERINALKKALATFDEFYLLYQPKISLLTGKAESMEALVRWQSSSQGFMRPDQFIRLAEETNLIISLGAWITEQAFRDFMILREQGCLISKVSINVSSVQLLHSDMVKTVKRAISKTGIQPEQVELEITESSLATEAEKALQTLKDFRSMNIELAIDDFGTGYSSMSYLQKLPVTRLKIDKSFIDNLSTSEESRAVVKAIIALAKTFNLALTAEGVEHQEQLEFLKEYGCDEVQGYLYAKPLLLEEFEKFSRTFNASRKKDA
ncbi:MAG: EAL domain-containing protein [Candidatus Electrothrix sp. AR4]|nr:EAL domain-containing protein [Candidatus Electrothrix sp. AR4]